MQTVLSNVYNFHLEKDNKSLLSSIGVAYIRFKLVNKQNQQQLG